MVASAGSTTTPHRPLVLLALVALLAALTFPFAPVRQPEVRFDWTAADGTAAFPLMPYQPIELRATTSCATARQAGPRVLLSTVPLRPDPAADPLYGLRLTVLGDRLRLASAGTELGEVDLPAADCVLSVVSTPQHTELLVDDAPVLTRAGDVRPDVVGAFSELPAGVSLTLTTDTRFQTSPSPLKLALGGLCLVAVLGVFVLLGRADRVAGRRVRWLPSRWWRPRLVDAAVGVLLAGWWLVGSVTVDDSYIAGIVRSRDSNGFVGNVYRWLNAPEAPFSWIYELYAQWSVVSSSTGWLRLPSVLLGLATWLLLSRWVLPRLGRFARRPVVGWLAVLAFGTWWIPFNLGLRPEPWVALGGLAVFGCVERALATRHVRPVAFGLLLAGAGTAVTPAGLMAFAPLVAATPRLARLLRARRDLHSWPLIMALVAAPAAAVLLMVADQSAGAVLEAIRVRQLIGGGGPWFAEYQRYAALLEPDSFQGAIGRRAAVLVTLLAALAAWPSLAARAAGSGLAVGPTRRLVLGFGISLAALAASPTKWSQHFGDLAGLGPAVLVLGLVVGSAAALRDRPRRAVAGLAAGIVVAALVLSGRNLWPSVSGWFTPSFSTKPVDVAGVPLATVTLVLGGAIVVAVLARASWLRSGGTPGFAIPRRLPAPAPLLAALLVAVLVLQVGSLARVAVRHADSYTPAADVLATVRGQPCGLQPLLSVELRPGTGLLLPRPGP
ncbi:MAG TPA: arabinosyltransferase domain-containing protein, partial [Pseudonocardia sp.]|nr:arabinosyltransferase domain-containing protein [Pseudonocardia sp.]